MPPGALPLIVGAWLVFSGHAPIQLPAPADCPTWQECRDQVEQAIAAGSFERAHDLAWRALQRGPRDDAALMFLLARAQSLAGRPHDALVMVRRIAERGIPTDALTHADLARTRALPGWPEVEAVVARANAGESAVAPPPGLKPRRSETPERSEKPGRSGEPERSEKRERSGEPSTARRGSSPGASPRDPVAPAAPLAAPAGTAPSGLPAGMERRDFSPAEAPPAVGTAALVNEAARFTTDPFVAAGLAYDAVSRRYLFGDRDGRKLRVVGEGLDHAVDLVRAESAGFLDIRGLAIDTRRGDLWVASADAEGRTATLHKLQLVSGRPLRSVEFAAAEGRVLPVDLAVTTDGGVMVLDSTGGLHRLRHGASAIETVAQMNVAGANSLAPGASEGVWFVAHEAGLSRVDLPSRRVTALGSPKDVSLAAFERIRTHRDGLVGIQADARGIRRVVRLELNSGRRSVQRATTFDTEIGASAGPVFLAVSGDELSFVTTGAQSSSPTPAGATPALEPAAIVVHRLRLR